MIEMTLTLRETDGIISLIPVGESDKSRQPQHDDHLRWLDHFHRLLDESADEELIDENFVRSRIIRKIELIDEDDSHNPLTRRRKQMKFVTKRIARIPGLQILIIRGGLANE